MKVNNLYNWVSFCGIPLAAGQLASWSVSKTASCHHHIKYLNEIWPTRETSPKKLQDLLAPAHPLVNQD